MAKTAKKRGRRPAKTRAGNARQEGVSRSAAQVRKRHFALEWLDCRNATEAAKRAGYSERTAYSQGSRLLKDVEVKAIISAGLAKLEQAIEERTELNILDVVDELVCILQADPLDAFDPLGNLKPIDEWPKGLRRACSGMEVSEDINMSDPENPTVTTIRKVKFAPKTQASDQLLKYLGGYVKDNTQKTATLFDALRQLKTRREADK